MTAALFILYVRDQAAATRFYAAALAREPRLNVPGMTEFALSDDGGSALGLMPEAGVRRLLPRLPDPAATDAPRAELYLRVPDPADAHQRALGAGARELSPLAQRDWGDEVAYTLDPDGHVLAFARVLGTHP